MARYPGEIPVLIIGAGPTGLTLANLLTAYGVDFVIVEREPAPLNLPRAIVLDDEGSRTLQVFGLDRNYLQKTVAAIGSRYYSDNGTCFAETGAGPMTYGFAKRQYIFQPELEAALRESLEAKKPGCLFFSSEVRGIRCEGKGAHVSIMDGDGNEQTIFAHWVAACDGGRSPTRERFGITMTGNTYNQDWIVLDMTEDPDTSRFSKFFCSNLRPAVSVPAPSGGRRYEFMLLPGETREQVLQPDFLSGILKPFRPYNEANVLRKTVYTFHARIAERFRQERVLLMGDAAHLTPPFAGQGMNAGLRDAHNVAWKLAAVLNGKASDVIIDSYDSERREPVWDMIQLAVSMGNFVMPVSDDDIRFRDYLLNALAPFPAVKDYLINMRFKPKPRHPAGLYMGLNEPQFEASLVGEMIPQPAVSAEGPYETLDDALGSGFALVAQNAEGASALAALSQNEYLGLPLAKVVLNTGRLEKQDGVIEIMPAAAVIARPLLTHRDQIMLVRPDRYCASAFAPDALLETLENYASATLGQMFGKRISN
jgi:3-(3-hydroxy-phenyl)propionate hydroxylase